MKVLLTIRELAGEEAKKRGTRIKRVEIRPALSHEDKDESGVIMQIEVKAASEERFSFWEALSDKVDSLTTSLSRREKNFTNASLSIIVTHADGL